MNTSEENFPFLSYIEDNVKYVSTQNDKELISSQNLAECMVYLKQHFHIERLQNNPIKLQVSNEVLRQLENLLNIVRINFANQLIGNKVDVVTELYRCLRNSATNEIAQNFICFETNILETTKILFNLIHRDEICIKVMLQFLINLITMNKIVTERISLEFPSFLLNLIEVGSHPYECSALIYNISLVVPVELRTVEALFKLHDESNKNEFLIFFEDNCIERDWFWGIYDELKTIYKSVVLERLRIQQIEKEKWFLPVLGLNKIVSDFLKSPDIFFKINNATVYEDVHEVALLLAILSSVSSKDEYIKILQTHKDVLVTAAALLINFHKLGKGPQSIFTPIQKLSETNQEESINPVFGLKADLIRLIGNMCWKNAEMQNLAREAEVFPVILDCCNIDAKNPFIIQWCIFAIRNLCDNNLENQKVVSGLSQRGAVSSQVLDEFGITLNTDENNQLKIIPLDLIKK